MYLPFGEVVVVRYETKLMMPMNDVNNFRDTVVVADTRCTDKIQQRRDSADSAVVQRHHFAQAAHPGTERRQRYETNAPTNFWSIL